MNILIKKKQIKNVLIWLTSVSAFLLSTLFLVCIDAVPAYSFDFITKKEFDAEKNAYRDYPQKILFKKLYESSGADKRKIRNAIILKQVFDRNMQEKAKAGIVEYKKHFGIIKEVSKDNLRIWDPKTGTVLNYFTGIDRIPIENNNNFEVTESNIDKFAAIAYTIDNRIYKIQVNFILETPDKPFIKRDKNNNVITWSTPSRVKKPSAYRVFVNDMLMSTVKEPVFRLTRKKEQSDVYFVRAGYKHGESIVWSRPSPSALDETTANEIKQELHATKIYHSIITALNPSEWQNAQKILYDNKTTLTSGLDENRIKTTEQLMGFFRNMDEADRLATIQPETIKNLELVNTFYARADQQAKSLLPGIDVLFITQLKSSKIVDRITLLETIKKAAFAKNKYREITGSLNPAEWRIARQSLYDNRQFLAEHLDKEQKVNIEQLVQFFRNKDEGDRIGGILPETIKNLETANTFYKRADQKAKDLPSDMDVQFITQLKIDENLERIKLLKSKNRKLLAENTYHKVMAALIPSEWEKAKTMIVNNRQLMADHLDRNKKENTEKLLLFFKDIEEGDRAGNRQPETVENLKTSLMFYERADKKAKGLPPDIDVTFISQIKTGKIQKRRALLETGNKKILAQKTYSRIISFINPSEWQNARNLLFDNRQLLTDYLENEPKANTEHLIQFFRNVDEGDRLESDMPENLKNLDLAISFYERADQKAKALSSGIDVLFITQLKTREVLDRKALLGKAQKKSTAEETYRQITGAINPADWEAAKDYLYKNRISLLENLDDERKSTTEQLVQFFRDIDEGDRISRLQPENINNLEKALNTYRRAESTATGIPDSIDVKFITQFKTKNIIGRKAELEKQQELKKAPYDRKATIEQGLKNFKNKNYSEALNQFRTVYSSQIDNLRQTGKKRIKGLLSLPAQYRAEIVFLVELDLLTGKNKDTNTDEFSKTGLKKLAEKISAGKGLWVLIPQSGKKRIKQHIIDFNQ